MDAPRGSQTLDEMMTKTLWHTTWISLPVLMLACGQAVDVGSNEGGASSSGGASGATTASGDASGATTASGSTSGTDAGATTGGGAGPVAGTGSGADTAGGGANSTVTSPEVFNCDSSTYVPGAPPAVWPDSASCQPGSSSLQGTWTGYVQGLDGGIYPNEGNFRLTLQGDDDALCGSVIFGEPVELPPVTDPEQGYLVEGSMYLGLQMRKGITYTLLNVQVSGERVTFGISLAEPYGAWCEQQTPYYDVLNDRAGQRDPRGHAGWNCSRNLDAFHQGERCVLKALCSEGDYEVDCLHHTMCTDLSKPCVCNGEGCAADVESQGPRFDLRFEASEAAGELDSSLIFLQRE